MEQLNVRQTACFCGISMLALKLIALPSLLLENTNTSGLVVAIILFIIDFLMLYIFLKIKQKYPNLSLYEIIEKYMGKIIAKIIYFSLIFFFLIKISILMNETVSYMQAIVDEDFKLYVFLLTFLPIISCIAYSGLKNCGRTCEFGFIFIIIGLIICLFLSEISFSFGELGPIFIEKPLTILQSCFNLGFWFSDFIFVAILSDKLKIKNTDRKTIFMYVFFVFILIFLIYLIYFRLFRVTAYLHKNAIADVTQYNRNIGNAGNIDIVSILVYLFVIYFQGSLYFYCLQVCYEKFIGYHNKNHSMVVINLIIVAMQFLVFYNLERIIYFNTEYFKYYNAFIVLAITLFYIVLLLFGKEGKNVKRIKKHFNKN